MKAAMKAALVGVLTTGAAFAARAADDDFYKGKQVQIVVSTDSGTSYDSYARLLAQHMPRHIPGAPSIIVQNMPGGGGLKVANYMANIAPRDGTVIAGTLNAVFTMSLTTPDQAKFDENKFAWIGSVTRDPYIAIVSNTAPIKTIMDARTTQVSMGGASAGTLGVDMVAISNALLGTKFKLIAGYKDPGEVRLAMQRGEVDGTFSVSWSEVKPTNLVQEGKVRIIAQHGLTRFPEFGDAPMLMDQAPNEDARLALKFMLGRQEAARPYFAPPGAPAERVAILRRAFDATVKDPAYLADAAAMKLTIDEPMNGEDLTKFVAQMHTTPKAVIDRVAAILATAR